MEEEKAELELTQIISELADEEIDKKNKDSSFSSWKDTSFLKACLIWAGMSQSKYCELTGWTKQRVSHLCNKRAQFPSKHLHLLKTTLNLSDSEICFLLGKFNNGDGQ